MIQPNAKMPRIGVLQVGTAAATQNLFETFKQGMREHGYVEGQHVVFERRLGGARPERIADVAAEPVRIKVDIIVTSTDQVLAAIRQQTQTIPITWRRFAPQLMLSVRRKVI
jgi:putative tryptophan/tyrosine transport system substrate-binding protein